MTSTSTIRVGLGRAFFCWPSRIGALALLALTLSWGAEIFAISATEAFAAASIELAER